MSIYTNGRFRLIQTMASSTYTSLWHAVYNRQEATVKLLLTSGAPVNLPGLEAHDSPLHLAVSLEYLRLTNTLLKNNADIFIDNANNICPLEIAIRSKKPKIIQAFFSKLPEYKSLTGVKYVKLLNSVLWLENMEQSIIENWLINPPPQVIVKDSPGIVKVLHTAIIKCNRGVVKLLLDNGVDINRVEESMKDFGGKTALAIACRQSDRHPLVEYLLQRGAKANIEGLNDTALHAACDSCSLDIVKQIVNSGADLYVKNSDGFTPISLAAKFRQASIVGFLLKIGKYNISDEELQNTVYAAVQVGDAESMEVIFGKLEKLSFQERLQYGVNTEVLKKIFSCETLYASGKYTDKCIESMVKIGYDVNFKTASGLPPLYSALMVGYDGVVAKLLQYGADVNAKCNNGRTPFDYLHQAIKSGNTYRKIRMSRDSYIVRPKRDKRVVDIFAQHVIKMKMVGLEVNQVDYDNAIKMSDNPWAKMERYQKEVENLKNTVICDDVTFYDIASANMNKMIRFLDNDVIYETLKTGKYKTKFRLFASIIGNSYHRGLYRKSLIDRACDLGIFDEVLELPYDCVRMIFDDYTNMDLVILIYRYQWYENDKILNKKRTNDCIKDNEVVHCNKKMKV